MGESGSCAEDMTWRMCELAEGESADVHIESHDLIQYFLNSRIVQVFLVCAE